MTLDMIYQCRVSPFGNPRIKACVAAPRGLSQLPTSFIAFLTAKASTVHALSSLNLVPIVIITEGACNLRYAKFFFPNTSALRSCGGRHLSMCLPRCQPESRTRICQLTGRPILSYTFPNSWRSPER